MGEITSLFWQLRFYVKLFYSQVRSCQVGVSQSQLMLLVVNYWEMGYLSRVKVKTLYFLKSGKIGPCILGKLLVI